MILSGGRWITLDGHSWFWLGWKSGLSKDGKSVGGFRSFFSDESKENIRWERAAPGRLESSKPGCILRDREKGAILCSPEEA